MSQNFKTETEELVIINCPVCFVPFMKIHRLDKQSVSINFLEIHDSLEKHKAEYHNKIHWQKCPRCKILNYNLHEFAGEQICYSCMKDMGLIGL